MALSAQDFIRALRAPADPPAPGAPAKIQIARNVWDDRALYVPNKGEAIVEWLLARLLKDKDSEASTNPVLDGRYWALLRDVLVDPDTLKLRPVKAWLAPILQRTPLAPVVIAALASWVQHTPAISSDSVRAAAECLSALWPLAVAKLGAETLLDCFAAVTQLSLGFSSFTSSLRSAVHAPINALCLQLLGSYRHALANASNKKKLFSVFTQQHLHSWILCVSGANCPPALAPEDIYEAGVETLFNVDILRQTQDRDDTVLSEPLSNAAASDPRPLCQILPRLLGTYIQVVRKHRAALFGQSSHQATGSSADQARIASLRFMATCDAVSGRASDVDVRWRTRVQLLQLVDAEGLYGATNDPVMEVLRRSSEDAIQLLAEAIRDRHPVEAECALGALATITHIDYDLVAHSVPRVLPLLLEYRWSTIPASAFLQHLLDYHCKTRTLDSLVETILAACSPQTANGIQVPSASAHKSPIFQYEFSDNLAKSIASFLTPGQVTASVDDVLQHLRTHLELLPSAADAGEKPQKKKRKVESPSAPGPTNANTLTPTAVAFSLASRIASAVLASLPSRYLLEDAKTHVVGALQEFYDATRSVLKDLLKRIKRGSDGDTQQLQWVASLIVRLRYTLRTSTVVRVSTTGDEKISAKLLSALSSGSRPCFRVEILRTLLSDVELTLCEPLPVIDDTLKLLESDYPGGSPYWNGNIDDIEDDGHSAIATCHLVFTRWLPLFDASATSEQLSRLASILTSYQPYNFAREPGRISLQDILGRCLHNAEIWELHRFRDVLLQKIHAVTEPLDAVDATDISGMGSKASISAESLASVATTFRLLLCIPADYLTRSVRNDLMRRAVAADIVCAHMSLDHPVDAPLNFREFLRRQIQFTGGAERDGTDPHLMFLFQHDPHVLSPKLLATTSELMRMYIAARVKMGHDHVLKTFSTCMDFVVADKVSITEQRKQLRWLGAMHAIDAVVAEAKLAELDPLTVERITTWHKLLSEAILPYMHSFGGQAIRASDIPSLTLLLNVWNRCLVLQRWLSLADRLPSHGQDVVYRLINALSTLPSSSYPAYVAAASVVQEEHRAKAATQQPDEDLTIVLASHLAFYKASPASGKEELDESLAKFVKGTSTSSFSYLLDLVYEGLSAPGLHFSDLAVLVHAYTLLLQNAPEGSSKIIHASWNSCLQLFAAKRELLQSSTTRLAVLRSISRLFNDRPALVRQMDLSSLWSILGSSLEGSHTHEPSTDKATFHEIISAVNALIRLRRDLVTSTLPHLAFILRRLLASLRHLRPQLGAKQSKMVTDTLPAWVSPGAPFAAEESKALARLLTTMTAKTVVRGQQQPSADAGKAESLARPFSKHAAYVLQAYIEALNDPLCVLPADTRRELEPGLFALCDMMGEYNRDALMVASLDAGGKTVLKALWREYEKQKYVGKG